MLKKFMLLSAIIGILTLTWVINPFKSMNLEVVQDVSQFFPSTPVIKLYKGGYENSGFVEMVDYVADGKLQVKHISGATSGVSIYDMSKEEVSISFRLFTDDYDELSNEFIEAPTNTNEIVMNGPIKKGHTWTFGEGENQYTYKITGIDVTVSTTAGEFSALEITSTSKSSGYKVQSYYVKGLGLIKTIMGDFYYTELIAVIDDFSDVKDLTVYDALEYYFLQIPSYN